MQSCCLVLFLLLPFIDCACYNRIMCGSLTMNKGRVVNVAQSGGVTGAVTVQGKK